MLGTSIAKNAQDYSTSVSEGMVVRLAHEGDRRATFVRLTPKGGQQFQVMAKAHEAWVGEILAGFSASDAETLIALLGNLGSDGVRPFRSVGDRGNHASVRV